MPGMWRRYYARWRVATREVLPLELLELMPPLARLCPPAAIVDKTPIRRCRYGKLVAHHSGNGRRTP